MKVKQLIELLKQKNTESEVFVTCDGTYTGLTTETKEDEYGNLWITGDT